MRNRVAVVFLTLVTVAISGCYRQVVVTGLPVGSKVIRKPWTSTYLLGAIAAKPIDVRRDCPDGVAIVEKKLRFMNGLGGIATLGIWTPQTVTVTCSRSDR